jgi:membrane protein involved in colicin uptake
LWTAYEDGRKKTLKELMPIIEQERKEKEQARRKAEQERKEKEQARRKAEQERKEKEQIKERLKATAKIMKNQGIALDVIKEATGLSDKEIEQL